MMGLAPLILAALGAALALGACAGDDEAPSRAPLSREEALERIDAICVDARRRVSDLGTEPAVRSRADLEQYRRYQQEALALLEQTLGRIERVPDPAPRRELLDLYVRFAREVIAAQRDLYRIAASEDEDDDRFAPRYERLRESRSNQAAFAARDYGLQECGS